MFHCKDIRDEGAQKLTSSQRAKAPRARISEELDALGQLKSGRSRRTGLSITCGASGRTPSVAFALADGVTQPADDQHRDQRHYAKSSHCQGE
jgi:hypothetical protein